MRQSSSAVDLSNTDCSLRFEKTYASQPLTRHALSRVRLSSDVSEIKLFFSTPYQPSPNIAPSWNVAPTDPLPAGPAGHIQSGVEDRGT